MTPLEPTILSTYSAFRGHSRIASGQLRDLALSLRQLTENADPSLILIFEDESGRQLDIDLSGSDEDVAQRFGGGATPSSTAVPGRRGRGRPKLGVVGREVTLLPRHWAWLQTQRGGPSASLRRLVDEARATHGDRDLARQAQDAINRFISATAGDLPGFEEVNRALYRGDRERFDRESASWPPDIRGYIDHWAVAAFGRLTDRNS